MKFDAIVGNPPYQESTSDTNRQEPVYHLFYNLAFTLSKRATLITPARFLFKVGQTPKAWMEEVLQNEHFKVVKYISKSSDVFPNVDIKGGVAITYHDCDTTYEPIVFFSAITELNEISKKVEGKHEGKNYSFANIVSSQGIYKFSKSAIEIHPEIKDVQSKGTNNKITAKSIESLPGLFFENKPNDKFEYIRIYARINNERIYRWIRRDFVTNVEALDSFKVFITQANGSGTFGETLSTPEVGYPNVGHTDTFLSIGKFETQIEAENCQKYIFTKFARALLGALKVTQNNPKASWAKIPLQNFSTSSDIDWTRKIADIDKQLYDKYQLSDEQRGFIEEHVQSMP